jgi:glycosyltransferase involved in cell wall biosynthesis
MRIGWLSAHPDMPTAYASQTAELLPRFQALGHEVALFATAGQDSHPSMWRGIPVFPKTPYADIGEDVVRPHYDMFKADLLVTFFCTWIIKYPQVFRDMRTIHLTPVDCDPMSIRDYRVIADTGGTPAAVSRAGEAMMRKGGPGREPLDPLYLPHGVNTKTFAPPADRDAVRGDMGYDGKFVVGMNFMNNDKFRKNVNQALRAFAVFHAAHPDSLLALHAIQALPEGYNLPVYARHLGIEKAVRWTPQYELVSGMIPPKVLADWYGALDVLMNPGNEGFGLPTIEAQACGTPVITGNWGTGPELTGAGWLCSGELWWNDVHQADWHHASVASLADCLGEAYEDARNRRAAARDNALQWEIGRQVRDYWEPVLSELG